MQSRFIKLSDYCLAEYKFEDLSPSSPAVISSIFYRLLTPTGEIYIYNEDAANDESSSVKTNNIKDLTVIPAKQNSGRFVYLDSEKVPNYTQYETSLIETQIPSSLVYADKIRYHLASGFQFTDFSNLVLAVRQDMNNGNSITLASILVNGITLNTLLKYNPRALIIGNVSYDRYIEIAIPSIKNIDEDYYVSTNKPNTFSYKITAGQGLIRNNPITLSLFECSAGPNINGPSEIYQTFDVAKGYTTQISQSNEFNQVGATIREAADGDYIEFFATYGSAFPEEFISILQKRTNSPWIIFHQLTVYEQVGSGFIKTGDATFFQEKDFDLPLMYRPILKNANAAITMAIDYSVRLINNTTNEQIIRTASLTVVNPNKYGKSLLKLQLANSPESQKISNLIIKKNIDSTPIFIDPTLPKPAPTQTIIETKVDVRTVTEYIPIFYSRDILVVAESSKLIKDKKSTRVAYGQGRLPITVNQFDNAFKFKILQIKPETNQPYPFDLTTFKSFELVFGSGNTKVTVSNIKDQGKVDAEVGELLFNVDTDTSAKILNLTDNKYYIVSLASDGTRSAIYTGIWYKPEDITEVDTLKKAEEARLKNEADMQEQIKALQAQIDALRLENDQLKKAAATPTTPVAAPSGSLDIFPIIKTPVKNVKPPRSTGYTGGGGGTTGTTVKPKPKQTKTYYIEGPDITGPDPNSQNMV